MSDDGEMNQDEINSRWFRKRFGWGAIISMGLMVWLWFVPLESVTNTIGTGVIFALFLIFPICVFGWVVERISKGRPNAGEIYRREEARRQVNGWRPGD